MPVWQPQRGRQRQQRRRADEAAVKGRTVLWANVADFKGLERPVALVAELEADLAAARLRESRAETAAEDSRDALASAVADA